MSTIFQEEEGVMTTVINGVVRVDGFVVGKVEGIKDGTVLDLSYTRPAVVRL